MPADEVSAAARATRETFEVAFASGQRTLCAIGPGLARELPALAARVGLSGQAALICDERVLALHGPFAWAGEAGWAAPIARAVGEERKALREVEAICDALAERKLGRDGFVVAVGGGVLTDLAGFAAAIYQRGIPWVSAPTTLLSQVDAGLGGKTGANLAAGKNLVGAFHQPRLVVADTALLATLPERERWSGLAEIVKTALLAPEQDAGGVGLLARCEAGLERAAAGDPVELAALVAACLRVKGAVVSADEREGGARASLNLGHTVGHALEAATRYRRFAHGEAVALGLRATLALSAQHAGLPAGEAERALRLVARLRVAPGAPLDQAQQSAALAAIARDKKARAGKVRFVLLERLGRFRMHDASDDDCRLALEASLRELR